MLVPVGPRFAEETLHGPIRVTILGSTGSIGCSALDVIRANPAAFALNTLCGGKNASLLARQAAEFKPKRVVVADENEYPLLADALRGKGIEICCGRAALNAAAAERENDLVLAAIVGFAGLAPVLAALRAGVDVALANKESLVAGGALVRSACAASGARVLPVDSEHSALFQALQGEQRGEVARFILTASGGPFLKFSKDQLAQVTVEQALRHPTWNMGPKVTIDSATLMNKALEFIEAAWLFAADESKISVVIHPQSIIHSLIAFQDGTQMAQLSIPDMKGPIAYALHYPRGRLPNVMRTLDLAAVGKLEFLEPDNGRFPALNLARESLRRGGCYPALFNAANEVAVRAFLERKLQFSEIVPSIERALQAAAPSEYAGYEELEEFVASSKRDLFAALGLMCEDRY